MSCAARAAGAGFSRPAAAPRSGCLGEPAPARGPGRKEGTMSRLMAHAMCRALELLLAAAVLQIAYGLGTALFQS